EVGAAPATGDQVPVRPGVVRVVVQVAGEHQADRRSGGLDDGTGEEVDGVVRPRVVLRLDPARGGRADDDRVARPELPGRLVEVAELRLVDVRAELRVDREQPPAVRQLDGEVRAGLRVAPPAQAVPAV